MSKKCFLCGKTKGKRGCRRHDMKLICPRCCADIRNVECDSCSYYHTAENYQAEKFQKSGGRSFVIELDEAVEKEVDKALGIDPDYELAMVNKALTEALAPGEKLDAQMRTIEYYKDYKEKNRSYVEDITKEMKGLLEEPGSKMWE